MTANGHPQSAFAPVLSALSTLHSNLDRSQKKSAHEYLETFQKSPEAWSATYSILQSADATIDVKLFAATTLKGKITYDLHQVPRDTLPPLRDTLLQLLSMPQPKPIRTQLCVCLALLAIQMLEWKNPLENVVQTFGSNQQNYPAMLEFLHVLPEEVNEGRKINLTEDELSERTVELLSDNAQIVLQLLTQYAQSSPSAAKDPQLMECISSWIREIDMTGVVNTILLDVVLDALNSEDSFDSAAECISALLRETRDVDECKDTIEKLYPRIMAIKPKIMQAAESEDAEQYKGVTRIFAEAGETWMLLIVRMPGQFRSLVEAILECAARDKDREVVSLTFNFWFEMKQYLVLDKYMESRAQLADLFSKLVDIMIQHLEYPHPADSNQKDLFDGDREQEDKFREFRHLMGDVLKDCCEVLGASACLRKPYELIERWVSSHSAQVQQGLVPDWQALEAPLFSMRAMGRMVEAEEAIMLPRLIPLITQIPDQEKVRFQAVMVLGRYTEWTAQHPETLQDQLQFILAAFDHPSKDVVQAAALSLQWFCFDCAELLRDHVSQLQQFYERVIHRLSVGSQQEVTEGVAAVVAVQPLSSIHQQFQLCCDPVVDRLKQMAQSASTEEQKLALADHIKLVSIFVRTIQPYVEKGTQNPAVTYCEEIFPVLARLIEIYVDFPPILERVCHCLRQMVLSYRSDIRPLLGPLAETLGDGFEASKQGCFLWATDAIIQEFSHGATRVDESTAGAIFEFAERQIRTFLNILTTLTPDELPDMIEDFFRMASDLVLYFPQRMLSSHLLKDVLRASNAAMTILKEETLRATLYFLRDFLANGSQESPTSSDGRSYTNPPEMQDAVKQLMMSECEPTLQQVMTGMLYNFPQGCFSDASGVVLAMFHLEPETVFEWMKTTLTLLPQGSITPQERDRLLGNISSKIVGGETHKVRNVLQDFATSYRRRNVMPREGLGRLEATKFKFSG
ncbi:MAG: hypothetical protein Q9162_006222 [Coniocarpon cinnabarinum]